MKTILSTKKLSLAQKELILNSGLSFLEYDAISIIPINFDFPNTIENTIFTSSNAVDTVFNKNTENLSLGNVFCVGRKTADILAKKGQNVVKTAKNSLELANYIVKTYKNSQFHFFCGR